MFSQSSVATYVRTGRIFNNHFTANLAKNFSETIFCNMLKHFLTESWP